MLKLFLQLIVDHIAIKDVTVEDEQCDTRKKDTTDGAKKTINDDVLCPVTQRIFVVPTQGKMATKCCQGASAKYPSIC